MTSSTEMSTRRVVLERPKQRAKALALIVEGKKDSEIAALMKVSRQAVTKFRARHQDEIAPAVEEVERQIIDYAIAHKVNRIADADADYGRTTALLEARANDKRYDEPGYSTGLMVHQLKVIGTGRNQQVIDEYKPDTALLAERRALRRSVAEELNDLPRGDVNITNNQSLVLVRQYGGFDLNAID